MIKQFEICAEYYSHATQPRAGLSGIELSEAVGRSPGVHDKPADEYMRCNHSHIDSRVVHATRLCHTVPI